MIRNTVAMLAVTAFLSPSVEPALAQNGIKILVERESDRSIQFVPLKFLIALAAPDDPYSATFPYWIGCFVGNPLEKEYRTVPVDIAGPTNLSERLNFGTHSFNPHVQMPIFPESLCLKMIPKYSAVGLHGGPAGLLLKPKSGRKSVPNFSVISANQIVVETAMLPKLESLLPKGEIEWVVPLQPGMKIDRNVNPVDKLIVEIKGGKEATSRFRSIFRGTLISEGRLVATPDEHQSLTTFLLHLEKGNAEGLAALAALPNVVRIEPQPEITLRSDGRLSDRRLTGGIGLTAKRGPSGKGQVIGIIDNSLDVRHCFFASYRGQPADERKVIYLNEPIPRSGEADFHGTSVAGIAAGQDVNDPFGEYSGVAPSSQIAFSPIGHVIFDSLNLGAVLEKQDAAKARIISNSWGDDSCRRTRAAADATIYCPYRRVEQDIDAFLWSKEEDLVIVAVSDGDRVAEPENAKNALAVAATIAATSVSSGGIEIGRGGSGPTDDQRRKPELLAPGCRVRTAEARTVCGLAMASQEDDNECATSWAAPVVAGEAARVREYFTNGWFASGKENASRSCHPTGALVKAVLLNKTVNVKEAKERDYYPSYEEGWGRLSLDDFLLEHHHGRDTAVVERHHKHGLREGAAEWIKVRATSLKATLVWMDAPSDLGASGDLRYHLDLEVVEGKSHYCGNDFVFESGESSQRQKCANFDHNNNVEQVVIKEKNCKFGGKQGCLRDFSIKITAHRVWKGIGGKEPRQPYALVVSGDKLIIPVNERRLPTKKNCSNIEAGTS